MKIPKKEIVERAISVALSEKNAGSQSELRRMVEFKLRDVDPSYSITGQRLREVALSMKSISVRPSLRKGEPPENCPSCRGRLDRTMTRNLAGNDILEKARCTSCDYAGGGGRWIPGRYGFRPAKSGK